MPNCPRRPDGEEHQEWAEDISNNGGPSGHCKMEVYFEDDNPNGESGIHLFSGRYPRFSKGHKTAIIIQGLSNERYLALTRMICEVTGDTKNGAVSSVRGSQRTKVLVALWSDVGLEWAD
ncbi:MAG: hypothetical protein UT36_C0004G0080 [Candidatus Peregrinibacteria bacterium GW2011_GWF2_39_17]|nr:MAG: hypothetical protein UT36_C0004G0080 [Candidatus Peregrinibacteria bacterium GW2011_GWF2_39_17]HCW32232.1 hypothetical protein [Candidatus Peregrinibacteria bacterium]